MREARTTNPIRAALAAATAIATLLGIAATVAPAGATPRAAAVSAATSPGQPEIFAAHSHVSAAPRFPSGFTDTTVFTGLSEATVLQFAADGRVYVGEKNGRIYEFDSLSDPTPLLVKDLSVEVYDWGDRGLLGMALDPNFTTGNPYVYVLYTLDAPIGGTPPVYNDGCPNGDSDQWCLAGARLSRFKLNGDGTGGAEQILIEDWCQQFPSHSIGTLAFGPDGALYVGGGDGGSYNQVDYGQLYGNPCGDPLNEGGALRAQDDRTHGDPTGMNGAILRVDPATGDALPDNPLVGNSDPTDDRIIAYGLRNPYRFVPKPGTDRIFVGDVGWYTWEELDRIKSAGDGKVEDFGWPCYEGMGMENDYHNANLPICNTLYAKPKLVTKPILPILHGAGCSHSNVLSGIEFYQGGTYPAKYNGALFMADVYDECLWTILPKINGDPKVSTFKLFASGIAPVDLKVGPGGDIFYVDWFLGQVHRISYTG
jgi:glucose/arabinose dehydrogenase